MLALLVPGVGMGAGTAAVASTGAGQHVNTYLSGVVVQPSVEISGGR